VVGSGSGVCTMMRFGISDVELSGSANYRAM
jgi:hypothetical protein